MGGVTLTYCIVLCYSGSDQDNCTNSRYIWESDPSIKRCPEEDWTVPVIAGLYMIFVNLLLVNIVIANFRLEHLNWSKSMNTHKTALNIFIYLLICSTNGYFKDCTSSHIISTVTILLLYCTSKWYWTMKYGRQHNTLNTKGKKTISK